MRVVITGVGVFTPLSRNCDEFWRSLLNRQSKIEPLRRFNASGLRSQLVQEIEQGQLDALRDRIDPENEFDAVAYMAIATAQQAWEQSRLSDDRRDKCGLYLASSSVGWESGEMAYRLWSHQKTPDAAYTMVRQANPANTFQLAHRLLRIGGPSRLFSAACASGGLAIGSAYDQVRLGRASAMLVCGADLLAEVPLGGFNSLRMVSRDLCRPFSRDRTGVILAEGAAAILIEPLDQAVERGANIICEIKGYSVGCDADHMTRPLAAGIARTMRGALENAGVAASEIALINAHGTGTKVNDASEAEAIRGVFAGETPRPVITALKSSQGHMQGCAGVFAAVSTAISLREKLVPPVANFSSSDENVDLDFVSGQPRPLPDGNALFNAFGFGGVSSSLVFSPSSDIGG